MRRLVAGAALSLAIALGASAAFGEAARGGQPGELLTEPLSARTIGMGGADAALADDATAGAANPAGLGVLQKKDLVTYYSALGEDSSFGALSYAAPTFRWGTLGLSYVGLRQGTINRRDALNTDQGNFSDLDEALLLSFGRQFGTRWALGGTAKAVHQTVDVYSGTGYGADVGALFRPHPLWQLGLSIQNAVAPGLKLRNATERYPRVTQAGVRFDPATRLSVVSDLVATQDHGASLRLGFEWRVADPLALRVGVNNRELSAGFGFSWGNAALDYAFGVPTMAGAQDQLGAVHRFSLHFRFGSDVVHGSYRDFTRLRKVEQKEIAQEWNGDRQLAAVASRMEGWNGQLDKETWSEVEKLRDALRRSSFPQEKDQLAAQAYIAYFRGDIVDSVRLFNKAVDADPGDSVLKRHRDLAMSHVNDKAAQDRIAAQARAFDDIADQRRADERLAMLNAEAGTAGGGGSAAGGTLSESGTVPAASAEEAPQGPFGSATAVAGSDQSATAEPNAAEAAPAENAAAETAASAEAPVAEAPSTSEAAPPDVGAPAAASSSDAAPEQTAEAAPTDEPHVAAQNADVAATAGEAPATDNAAAANETAATSEAPEPTTAAAAPGTPANDRTQLAFAVPPSQQTYRPTPEDIEAVLDDVAKQDLETARKSFDSENYVESNVMYRRVLERYPKNREAARQVMVINAYAAAEAAITDPHQAPPDRGVMERRVDESLRYYDQGEILHRRGDRDNALALYQKAVDVSPANFLARDAIREVNNELFDQKWDNMMRSHDSRPSAPAPEKDTSGEGESDDATGSPVTAPADRSQ